MPEKKHSIIIYVILFNVFVLNAQRAYRIQNICTLVDSTYNVRKYFEPLDTTTVFISTYKEQMLNGKSYVIKNNLITEEYSYCNDSLTGVSYFYDNRGKIEMSLEFERNKLNGEAHFFSKRGELIAIYLYNNDSLKKIVLSKVKMFNHCPNNYRPFVYFDENTCETPPQINSSKGIYRYYRMIIEFKHLHNQRF